MTFSKNLSKFKKDIESLSGGSVVILDSKSHRDWKIKPRAFTENNVIFVDKALSSSNYEEALFHELTHVYFRLKGYPRIETKKKVEPIQQHILDDVLSLPEDILVDRFLEENQYKFDKYDYTTELKKLMDIDDAGKYIKVGSGNPPPEIKILRGELLFIKLLTDQNYRPADEEKIKNICIKNLGEDEWEFIKKVSTGIKDILSQTGTDQEKLAKIFRFLIKMYNLKDTFAVRESRL